MEDESSNALRPPDCEAELPGDDRQARLLGEVVAMARAAGSLAMQMRAAGLAVNRKEDGSPVTDADRDSEALITKRLASLAASARTAVIVGEEACEAGLAPRAAAGEAFWLVDPLDGTRDYIRGRDGFTVNIALVEDGAPALGVVYAPVSGDCYAGRRGDFAVVSRGGGSWRRLSARRSPAGGLTAAVSYSHANRAVDGFLAALPIASRIAIGSSIKFCLLAEGKADIYPRLSRTMEWDTAAGHAILEASGGSVTTVDGATLSYGKGRLR